MGEPNKVPVLYLDDNLISPPLYTIVTCVYQMNHQAFFWTEHRSA